MPSAPQPATAPAASPTTSERRLVLVAGAGRSGTSTVAGILQLLGLHVPKPEVVPDETNPKGFSESQWVVDFHTDLLSRANVQVSDARPLAWEKTSGFAERAGVLRTLTGWLDEQFGYADQLVIKDPRLSWFLPLWRAAAQRYGVEPAFLTMLRPPPEVVGSKRTYYNSGLQDGHGVAAWVNMLLNTERATRGSARTFVRYHDLLEDWRSVVARVGADLDLPSLISVDEDQAREIDGFVDPGLRRISLTWDDLDLPERLAAMSRDAWASLDVLADSPSEDEQVLARLDEVHAAYDAYYLEAEVVARSSIHAARASRRKPQPEAAPSEAPTEQPRPDREGLRGVAARLARRLPPSVRSRIPESTRARARALLR